MTISRLALFLFLSLTIACSSMKTRKQAAEEARAKAEEAEQGPSPVGPIEEEITDGVATSAPKPAEDQILDDELAAMGIDPNNPDGAKFGTPEPEVEPRRAESGPAVVKKKPVAKKKKAKK